MHDHDANDLARWAMTHYPRNWDALQEPTESAHPHGSLLLDEGGDNIDFAMLDLPTRPGPAKASVAPEQDPMEARLAREIESAPYRVRIRPLDEPLVGIEVKHGSGKVKV